LLEAAAALTQNARNVMAEATVQGVSGGEETIKFSLQRLRQRCDLIAETLAQAGAETQTL
jgi:hypothetical protein